MHPPFMKSADPLSIVAIKNAIDDFAECEMGTRKFFLG